MTQPDVEPQALTGAGTWNVDPIHSQVLVSLHHMAVARLRAKFPRITGRLDVDRDDPLRSTFEIEVDARSVTTGQPAQEDFMRSEPWLDTDNHPSFTFRSTAIEPRSSGDYVVRGDLTLKGVTRQVEIPVEFHGVVADSWGLRAGFTSRLTLDRRDFGITWNREFDWGVMAGWGLEVSLDIELAHADESLAQRPRA
ncbi:MAG TPA: YceI family protein [Candidatus Eisenbacteria bacterium]|nr:YceI family protein [Candidatus Eisenbacteria bacterium]